MTRTQRCDGPAKRPSLHVVERIAEADGVDPIDLEPPLHDVVDTSSLDRLFKSTRQDGPIHRGSVSFAHQKSSISGDVLRNARVSDGLHKSLLL